jgi:hypothetical protein
MKKLRWILMVGIALLLCACVITPEVKIIGKMAARRVAHYVVLNNPELREPGILICEEILGTEDSELAQTLLRKMIDAAVKKIEVNDPWVVSDIKDLMELLKILPDGSFLPEEFDLAKLKFVVVGILEGLKGGGVT